MLGANPETVCATFPTIELVNWPLCKVSVNAEVYTNRS